MALSSPLFRKLSPTFAALSANLGAGRCMPLPALGDHARLVLAEALPADAPHTPHIQLDGPHGAIYLPEGEALLHALSGIDLAAARGSMRDWLVQQLLGRLPDALHNLVGSLRYQPAVPTTGDWVGATLTLRTDDHVIATHVIAEAAALYAWLAVAFTEAVQPALPADWGAMSLAFAPRLASHRFQLNALDALAVGDIVLPDRAWFDCIGQGELHLAGRTVQVGYQHGAGFVVDGWQTGVPSTQHTRTPNDMQEDMIDAGASDSLASLAELELDVHFELDTLHLSLADLGALVPGSVLQLDGLCPPHVWIQAGGRRIGRGEIVDVDGRLGIQVTERVSA